MSSSHYEETPEEDETLEYKKNIGRFVGRLVVEFFPPDHTQIYTITNFKGNPYDEYICVSADGKDLLLSPYSLFEKDEDIDRSDIEPWQFFSSHEEYHAYVDEHLLKIEVAVSALDRKRAPIFADVAEKNAEQRTNWYWDDKRGEYSLWHASVVNDKSKRMDDWDKSFCFSLTMSASNPDEVLDYIRRSVSGELSTRKRYKSLESYRDSSHLWIEPRLILIEYLGCSYKEETRCISMSTYE